MGGDPGVRGEEGRVVEDGVPAAGDGAEAEEQEGRDAGEHLEEEVVGEGRPDARLHGDVGVEERGGGGGGGLDGGERGGGGAAVSSSSPRGLVLRIALGGRDGSSAAPPARRRRHRRRRRGASPIAARSARGIANLG